MKYESLNELNMDSILLNKNLDEILNYMSNNPDSNPKAFEMNDIMYKVSTIISSENEFGKGLRTQELLPKFNAIMSLRLPQLISDVRAYTLADYFTEELEKLNKGESLGDKHKHEFMNNLCGTNLWIHQRLSQTNREDYEFGPLYDNEGEFKKLGLMSEMADFGGTALKLFFEVEGAYMKTPEEYNIVMNSQNKGR